MYLSVRVTAQPPTAEEVGILVRSKFCHYHPHHDHHIMILWLVSLLCTESFDQIKSQNHSVYPLFWSNNIPYSIYMYFFLPVSCHFCGKPLSSIFKLLLDHTQFCSLFLPFRFPRLSLVYLVAGSFLCHILFLWIKLIHFLKCSESI